MAGRAVLVHAGLVVIAGTTSLSLWTRDKTPHPASEGEVTVWSGRANDVERISFEAKGKKVVLEAKADPTGRWLLGTYEHEAPVPLAVRDAGGEGGPASAPASPPTTVTFASTTNGTKLAESLATLHAVRGLGKIPADRVAEFGLADPESTITVRIGGAERKLAIGGSTPGGTDRYALDPAKGEAYVVKGDIVRDLEGGDSRLTERDIHTWKEAEPSAIKITAASKVRSLVRGGTESKKFWADGASTDKNDETAGNWMSKIDRLRIIEYAAAMPPQPSTVCRVDYTGPSGTLGYVEVMKTPPTASPANASGSAAKFDCWVKTEHTHLAAKVSQPLCEQIEQDLNSVVH